MASGVRVVGAAGPADAVDMREAELTRIVPEAASSDEGAEFDVRGGGASAVAATAGDQGQAGARHRKRVTIVLACLAVLGIAGTVGFGLAWAGLNAHVSGEMQARAASRSFLVDLTNFDPKTVDADFEAITSMATGPFSAQAQKFFNSTIREELEKALASSRGQVRALYVQSYGTGQATVYAVVDQLYANDKTTTPQTDVLRIVLTMSEVSGRWKVADVTVLQGPTLSTGGSSSAKG